MSDTLTESVEVDETELVESTDAEVNKIDELSDEEFTEQFENDTLENPDEIVEEELGENEPKNLDDLYRDNLGTDKKLDEPMVIKVDGHIYEIDSLDEIRNLMERGSSATRKFQKLSEDRKALEKQLEELGQTPEVKVDTVQEEVDSISDDILNSSYADVFTEQLRTMPDEVRQLLGTEPDILRELSIDYERGFGEKVMPEARRLMALKGIDFLPAYTEAGKALHNKQTKITQAKSKTEMLEAQPKAQGKIDGELGTTAINSMTDSEFNAYFDSV